MKKEGKRNVTGTNHAKDALKTTKTVHIYQKERKEDHQK